jgi:hypothetical protein
VRLTPVQGLQIDVSNQYGVNTFNGVFPRLSSAARPAYSTDMRMTQTSRPSILAVLSDGALSQRLPLAGRQLVEGRFLRLLSDWSAPLASRSENVGKILPGLHGNEWVKRGG